MEGQSNSVFPSAGFPDPLQLLELGDALVKVLLRLFRIDFILGNQSVPDLAKALFAIDHGPDKSCRVIGRKDIIEIADLAVDWYENGLFTYLAPDHITALFV